MMPRFACFAVLLFASAAALGQGPKIGFVDSGKIAEIAPQATEALDRLENEFSSREAEIRDFRAELRSAEAELDKNAPIMTQSDIDRAQLEISAMRRKLSRLQQDFKDELNLRRNQELTKLQRIVTEAIIEIAKEEGFDLIVEQAVYWNDSVDITERVLEKLRQ